MNKKLLFSVMSLAALAACTNDDFEGQQQIAEATSPIQFEVINNSEGMRASMDGNTIVWSATAGDLFTLYHGNITAAGYQNATYTASEEEGAAVLTTPSMIKAGKAIMVWPVDTTFANDGSAAGVNISIPAEQKNIENNIPYVSDVINITADAFATNAQTAGYNKSGYARKYPVYMRPMAHQLTIKADYAGTDALLSPLYSGEDAINAIEVSSIELSNTANKFTTVIPLTFTGKSAADNTRWNAAEPNNAWSDVTGVGAAATQVKKLTAKDDCLLDGNQGCKFLILKGSTADGNSAVIVNTTYGKVVVAPNGIQGSAYVDATEGADVWYRYLSAATAAAAGETKATSAETSGEHTGKYKTTANIQAGMTQTFGAFDAAVASASNTYVAGEPVGVATTRYVKVLLSHLDMSALHITSDKQLRDAARVWQAMNLPSVTVYLDGDDPTDANGKFEISQQTIKKINEINAATAPARKFTVKPCNTTNEVCKEIVITGADTDANIQDLSFILVNGAHTADVVLKAGETWNWAASTVVSKKAVIVDAAATGVNSIINKGTLVSNATATLAVYDNASPAVQVTTIPFVNEGTWNVTTGKTFVQFAVTNNGTVNISAGAEYRQDGAGNVFTNEATDVPSRFGGDDGEIATVNNSGVFATVNSGTINNYGLIEHVTENAKTYITANQLGGNFNAAFAAANKMGRINLKYSNKDEDNISINAAADQGFVSVTVDGEVSGTLNATAVGTYVNYIIVNSGVTKIAALPAQIKYVEIDDKNDTEIAWNLSVPANYLGLMVLSPVNIKLGTTIKIWDGTTAGTGACYLGSDMYVGGTFNNGTAGTLPSWNGYYGNTTANFATKYVTY